jgi:hypothetical protein
MTLAVGQMGCRRHERPARTGTEARNKLRFRHHQPAAFPDGEPDGKGEFLPPDFGLRQTGKRNERRERDRSAAAFKTANFVKFWPLTVFRRHQPVALNGTKVHKTSRIYTLSYACDWLECWFAGLAVSSLAVRHRGKRLTNFPHKSDFSPGEVSRLQQFRGGFRFAPAAKRRQEIGDVSLEKVGEDWNEARGHLRQTDFVFRQFFAGDGKSACLARGSQELLCPVA